jgi:hypothetical protein
VHPADTHELTVDMLCRTKGGASVFTAAMLGYSHEVVGRAGCTADHSLNFGCTSGKLGSIAFAQSCQVRALV